MYWLHIFFTLFLILELFLFFFIVDVCTHLFETTDYTRLADFVPSRAALNQLYIIMFHRVYELRAHTNSIRFNFLSHFYYFDSITPFVV